MKNNDGSDAWVRLVTVVFILASIAAGAQLALIAQATSQAPVPRTATPQQQSGGSAPSAPAVTALTDRGWPREIKSGPTTLMVYQPQLDTWDGFNLTGRAAVAATESPSQNPAYGIVQFSTQTHVDKDERIVRFEKFTITNANFPQHSGKSRQWASLIEARAANIGQIALDRLEAAHARATAEQRGAAIALKNDPPRIIVSTVPAILIPVDGQPVYRDVAGTSLSRILNTRPLVLRDKAGKHYLKIFDGWMEAPSLLGEWTVTRNVPPECDTALKAAISTKTADLLVGGSPDDESSRPSLAKGAVPHIYVATGPTELIVTSGQPNYVPIEGLTLTYADNTTGNLFVDTSTQEAYVLVSGRWFAGTTSFQGPWRFVPGDQLPPSFAKIPDSSAKENVKASVPGTPQAEEAVVANSVPQTAKVKRSTATFTPTFDGAPKIERIEGTELHYVANSSDPIIAVGTPAEYFAVENGVWFVSSSLSGGWIVATRIPDVIYSIPASSPVHYVTYVRVYDHTPDYVVVGYTPGYYGTYVSGGTIVYGTGYVYTPWVGTYWYGYPVTYGFGVTPCYTPWAGWAMGFGFGWAWGAATVSVGWGWGAYPWWGPAYGWGGYYPWVYSGAYGAAWGPRGAAVWGPGYWGGTTGNVYSRWGSTTAMTRTAGGFNAWTGNGWARESGMAYNSRTGTLAAGQRAVVGNVYTGNYATVGGVTGTNGSVVRAGDNVYAGRDGNVYRHQEGGGWEQRTSDGWQTTNSPQTRSLENDRSSRSTGDQRYDNYRSGGFRSAGGGGRTMRGGGRR